MPFTPSHVAAVLPLRGRLGMPFAALAAGSMSPDLPYFLPFTLPRGATHSFWSIPTWDLLFGLAMWLVWRWAAPALHDLAPGPIRRRWQLPATAPSPWWGVALAVMIGAATHVVWDSFTHTGYQGSTIDALAALYPSPIGPLPGYRWLQYTSGALGLAIVLWVGFRQPVEEPRPRRQPYLATIAPAVLFTGALLGAAIRTTLMTPPLGRRALTIISVTSSISGAGLSLLGLCLIHAIVTRYRSSRDQVRSSGPR